MTKTENRKLKIIFLGTPYYLNPIVKTLDENFNLVKTIRKTEELNNETMKQFSNLNPDLLVVASFGKIIPQEILQIPRLGAINIHPSQLPLYRGPSPIQDQILDGVTESAISFILMDGEMDHGPILHQEDFKISETDTFESLCQKMFERSAEILPQVINGFSSGKITPRLQSHAIAEYCNLIKKEDGYFDINNPPDSQTLNRMIRAYYPWPTAWTLFRQGSRGQARIVKLLPDGMVQMEGKKPVAIKDFLNGYPDFPIPNFN